MANSASFVQALEEVQRASSQMMELAVPATNLATCEFLTHREAPLANTFLNFIEKDDEQEGITLLRCSAKRRSRSILSYVPEHRHNTANGSSMVEERVSIDMGADRVAMTKNSCCDEVGAIAGMADEGLTTVMVQNLPRMFTQKDFLNSLDAYGLEGTYDFCYVPVCFTNGHSRGYAFVNFRTHESAVELVNMWQNTKYTLSKKQKKPLIVTFAETQGLTALLAQPAMKRMQRVRNLEFRPFVADEMAM
mmetsp:Transcript_22120/g.40667  ORF Transcript_22120/g.40667 Transcript_22120/m.40667 type:complete len:249 (+) Transcript_22120:82-828(+)